MSEKPEKSKSIENQESKNEETFKEENTKDLIYNKLIYSEKLILFQTKFIDKIIEIYFHQCKITSEDKITKKLIMRNISFFIKFLKHNKELKLKTINIKEIHKIISQLLILFNKNIWILITKYKKEKTKESFHKIDNLNKLLKIILNVIGTSYISGLIDDEYFELIIKNTLIFSSENLSDEIDKRINSLSNMIFFIECIKIIKIVFNKIYLIQKKYSERQKEIIKNIIIHINNNIFGSKDSKINYLNKCLLSKNDCKTSLLIDLAHIISKMNSSEINNYFINLLSNIYSFSFHYENCMKSILKLFEPLILNLNNKNLDEIHSELELSDFILNYLEGLNNKEKALSDHDGCLLKNGFYFGNKSNVIYGDINSNLETDFIILFGFKLEGEDLDGTILFELYNEEKTQIKFYINRNLKRRFELFARNETKEYSTNINIVPNKTYIISFYFTTEGFLRNNIVKIKYIKDDNIKNKIKEFPIFSGVNLKFKNINNIKKICIGCDRIRKKTDIFVNKFNGFIGDFIILNSKHIKENLDSKLYDDILNLKHNYSDILKILSDNNSSVNEDISENLEFNSTFNDTKYFFEKLVEKPDLKTNITINTIISQNFFKLIEFKDDMDYMSSFNSYNYYLSRIENPISIKNKYFNQKMKSDFNYKKSMTINSSIFTNEFNIFERKYSLIEFVKYEGIHFLSLLFEYYYQILCYLIEVKDNVEQNIIKVLIKEINLKMIKLMRFFNNNILKTNLYEYNYSVVNQFFYQMSKAIFKFNEFEEISFDIFKCIIEIITSLDKSTNINKKESFQAVSLMKKNLIEILINPRIYNIKNGSCFEKLNYTFYYLLISLIVIKFENNLKVFSIENLEKLMSFSWLLDEPKKDELYDEAKKHYSSLLILFLEISTSVEVDEIIPKKILRTKTNYLNMTNIEEENCGSLLISEFLNKSLEYRKNKNKFFHLSLILVKTNLVSFIKEKDIENLKSSLLTEIKFGESKDTEYKKIIYLSYLQILISYYFSENKFKNPNATVQNFNNFISSLNLDKDLFFALIGLINLVNNFKKLDEININNYKKEKIKIISKSDYPIFSELPFKELNIEKLNDIQIYIIKNIFLDILELLENFSITYGKKDSKFNSNNESNKSTNIEKDIFEIIKKNIDIIFKFPKTKLHEVLFSSESNICTKLLYIKLKSGEEKNINYIKTVSKKYYKELIKNNYCPFIFKFLLNISNENLDNSSIDYKIINDFKSEMIIFIIGTLKDFSKEIKSNTDNMPFYIYNLLNCLILLNKELNYKSEIIYKTATFYDSVYTLISLISEALLYSNYCIEFEERYGKFISEIILDIFMVIPQKFFKQNYFINTFINSKEKMTVFYIIDISKEKILKKAKKSINFLELTKIKEINSIITLNQKKRKINLVEENKMYQIDDINFTIYFLAKCYVYLNTNFIKEKENEIKAQTLNMLIACLSDDLYILYTRNKNFYGTKNCDFPLYDETKKYFESYIIQNYNSKDDKNSKMFRQFFDNDLLVILKDEYSLDYCFASRLHKVKSYKENYKPHENTNIISEEKQKNQTENNDDSSTYIFVTKKSNSNTDLNNVEVIIDNLCINNDEIKEKTEINYNEIFPNSFEQIEPNLIIHPRNFFLKNIFSNVYKDIIFHNKLFTSIKKIYLTKYGKKIGLVKESKQMDYPTRQKNYSNFLEPRIFLQRDFNFYDEIFFPISYQYLPEFFKNKKLEELFFYKHKIQYFKKYSVLNVCCELVTNQFIYFGKLYFFKNYIIFEKEKDPRDDPNEKYNPDIIIYYTISTKSPDKYPTKNKFLIIFLENISQIIKRRSLLAHQSIEIFLKNGKSYFFNFFRVKYSENVYQFFEKEKNRFPFVVDIYDKIKNVTSQFHTGKISNYDYILNLNIYATRTYCDLSQYPIFPWCATKHENTEDINPSTNYLRNMKYPISVQDEEKRNQTIEEYKKQLENLEEGEETEEKEYPSHFQVHYSNAAFVYYYLMRLNPYGRDLIKLQNYHNENPNRIFSSFQSLEKILKAEVDNRELIPDFFCYFDFLINLNCSYFGQVKEYSINDDFEMEINSLSNHKNIISPYVYNLYREKKLLNSSLISKTIHEWVDIIFGKNQLVEENAEKDAECCNIFNKYSYEQRADFEKELELKKEILNDKNTEEKKIKQIFNELKGHIGYAVNFGITPRQILKTTVINEGENKFACNEFSKSFEDKIIYYEKVTNDEYLILKDSIKKDKKDKNKIRNIGLYNYKNKSLFESQIYDCKRLNLMKKYKNISIEYGNKKEKIPLYNPCYSLSYLNIISGKKNKLSNLIILSCRYLGNYFNVQSIDKNMDIKCEDFVTCIKAGSKEYPNNFYTGLFNGKLIEWKINNNFEVNIVKHIYSHYSPITIIELYNRQNIIITAGEDKYIHIRKQYDFELLTAINLNYCYSNPIVSENINIFPSLIKISDLNLLYVILYDLDTETNFIRGYNLNGLFFAQTEKEFNINNKNKKYIINNISFTKNSNLIIGFYNSNNYALLQCWDLNVYKLYNIDDKKNREGTRMIIYEPSFEIFNIIYDNEVIKTALNENDKLTDY